MTIKFNSDIDIDFSDRTAILRYVDHTPAARLYEYPAKKHTTGVYVTAIPYNPVTDMAAIDYQDAEARGYIKLDFLNVHVYSHVKDESHLVEMMEDPDWSLLTDRLFFEQLIHIGAHYDTMMRMPEPVDSIPRLAMFLAIIRPAKRHLIGKPWSEVAKTIWDLDSGGGYAFKRAHAVSYAHLVVVHMNLIASGEIKKPV